MWRRAKFYQYAIAQSLRIALTRLRERHDLVCDHFIGKVAAIGKSKRYQSHLESDAHNPDRLRIKFLAI
jgi:hypothetical protein